MTAALLIIAGVTLTLLQCLEKWGITTWYQARRKAWMPEADCALCLGFWTAWVVGALYVVLALYAVEFILIPWAVAGPLNVLITFYQALRHDHHPPH